MVYDSFGTLNIDEFSRLLKRVIYKDRDLDVLMEEVEKEQGDDGSFARRLMTGQAAEQNFKSRHRQKYDSLPLQRTLILPRDRI